MQDVVERESHSVADTNFNQNCGISRTSPAVRKATGSHSLGVSRREAAGAAVSNDVQPAPRTKASGSKLKRSLRRAQTVFGRDDLPTSADNWKVENESALSQQTGLNVTRVNQEVDEDDLKFEIV